MKLFTINKGKTLVCKTPFTRFNQRQLNNIQLIDNEREGQPRGREEDQSKTSRERRTRQDLTPGGRGDERPWIREGRAG